MTAEEFSGKVVVVTGGSRGIGRFRTTTDYPPQSDLVGLDQGVGARGDRCCLEVCRPVR